MSEQKDKKQHQRHGNDRKNQDKPPLRRNCQQYEQKKKDPEAIHVLQYGKFNYFMKFKEGLSEAALKEYGSLSKVIMFEYIEVPEAPDRTYYGLEDDTGGLNRQA
jgi:hypothetical protein